MDISETSGIHELLSLSRTEFFGAVKAKLMSAEKKPKREAPADWRPAFLEMCPFLLKVYRDGVCIGASREWERRYGIPVDDVVGNKDNSSWLPEDQREAAGRLRHASESGSIVRGVTFDIMDSSGSPHTLTWSATPPDGDGIAFVFAEDPQPHATEQQ